MRPGIAALALACGLVAGCGLLPMGQPEPEPGLETVAPAPVQAPSLRRASDVETLVVYYQHLRRLAPLELGREHEAARQALLASRSDYNRVRMGMLLSLPGAALADEPRALELLEPVARNSATELAGLAGLLVANLQERRRLDANAQGLQQKLDALRALERSMLEKKR